MSVQETNSDYQYSLLAKLLSKETTEEERKEIDAWRNDSSIHDDLFRDIEAIETLLDELAEVNVSDVSVARKKLKTRIQGKTRPRTAKTFLRYAATVVIIAALASIIILVNKNQKVSAEIIAQSNSAEIISVKLPDGSLADLNKNSRLVYPETFGSEERVVKLEGEAFFDIAPDAYHPFVIITRGSKIVVLGTAFNVSSNDYETEVVVEHGSVSLEDAKGAISELVLNAGEKGRLNITEGTSTKEVNSDKNRFSWRTGVFCFEETQLQDVLDKLSGYYNIQFSPLGKDFSECTLSASFDHQPISAVLRVIEQTLDLEFNKKADLYSVSGKGCIFTP